MKERRAEKADLRREEVARATWKLMGELGVEGTSLRAVAHALETTTGMLTHYFRNREDMITYTKGFMAKLVGARMRKAFSGDPKTRLWRSFRGLLSTSKDRRHNEKVWLAFIAAGLSSPKISGQNEYELKNLRLQFEDFVKEGHQRNKRKSSLNPEDEADLLVCLSEGLSLAAIVNPKQFTSARLEHLGRIGFESITRQSIKN